jgi:hypothetical protein
MANQLSEGVNSLFNFDGTVADFFGTPLGGVVQSYLLTESGALDPKISPSGYQGTVPELVAVREQVPFTNDPNRRAGSGGRRYFTDTVYIPKGLAGVGSGEYRPDAQYGYREVDAQGNELDPSAVDYTPTGTYVPYQIQGATEMTNLEAAEAGLRGQAQQLAAENLASPYGGGGQNLPYAKGGIASPLIPPYADKKDEEEETKPAPPGLANVQYNIGGGVKQLAGGRYLDGMTDGMADRVPSSIDGIQPAALSDGEFVIPADVVSHLGNGSSNAGAKVLDNMMTNVRKARTGNPNQGKEINPQKVMAAAGGGLAQFANGGNVQRFNEGGPTLGTETGIDSTLASYLGKYVTDMLGTGQALAQKPYDAYMGPLTAGESALQQQAFEGIGGLQVPEGMGRFDPATFDASQADKFMSPYLQASLEPQLREARRQAEINRLQNAGRMTQAGSFGGSRQAILDAENQRNLGMQLGDITAKGYETAYDKAMTQFNTEQDRLRAAQDAANTYGLQALQAQQLAGDVQRNVEAEGIAADKAQFEEERLYPYKNLQYQQSLLQGLPVSAANRSYAEGSQFAKFLENYGGVTDDTALDTIGGIFGQLAGLGSGAVDAFGTFLEGLGDDDELPENVSVAPADAEDSEQSFDDFVDDQVTQET